MQIIRLIKNVLNHPLNQDKTGAVKRLLSWQIASRLMAGPIAFPFVEDSRLFAINGMAGATGNWYCGLHEVEEMAFVLHALQEDELFIDIGANIGSYTVLAAAGPKAKVISIEPIPSTFKSLALNVKLNGLDERVSTRCIGLSDRKGTLRFSAELDTVNHVLLDDEKIAAIEVNVLTLDEVVNDNCPTIIKIDVEGHELPTLRGGLKTLKDSRLLAVVMETNGSGARYGWGDQELEDIMQSYGFEAFSYEPFKRDLIPQNKSGANTVFVRDKNEILRRVKSSRKYKVGHTSI